MSDLDFDAERGRALYRLSLAAVLAVGVGSYKPPPTKGASAKGAAASAARAGGPSSASVSWINGGAPLDERAMARLKAEAEAGVAGASVQRLVDDARRKGLLDKPMANGMTMEQALKRAQEISDEVNAKAEERAGGGDEPSATLPRLIVELGSPHEDVRAQAAMLLCDNRYAKLERAVDAVPALEAIAGGPPGEAQGFAEVALKRVRFWEAKRRYLETPR